MGKGKVVFEEEGVGRLLRSGEEPAVVSYKLTQMDGARKSREIGFVLSRKPSTYQLTKAFIRFSERPADSESALVGGRAAVGRTHVLSCGGGRIPQ